MNATANALGQLALWGMLFSVAGAAIGLYVTYYVLKRAIRDGIAESGIVEATRQRTAALAAVKGTRGNASVEPTLDGHDFKAT
jgi:hypothetical protein